MKIKIALFLIFIQLVFSINEVKFVFNFFRNGISSPNKLNEDNSDIFKEKWKKPSLLTTLGMKQQYTLGMKLRQHYIYKLKFLNEKFSNEEFKIFTVDKSSNILTTYIQLLGMYPAALNNDLDENSLKYTNPAYDLYNIEEVSSQLQYSPLPQQAPVFPIKSFPRDNNYFGLSSEENCKGVLDFLNQNKQKDDVKQFINNFSNKYSEIFTEALNLPKEFLFDYSNLNRFCTDFLAGYSDKRDFNSIKKQILDKQINLDTLRNDCRSFKSLDVFSVRLGDINKNVIKISTTNIISQLVSQFDEVILKDNNGQRYTKFMIFNGELEDMASFMAYLNLSLSIQQYYPTFSSTILIELSKVINDSRKSGFTEEDYAINLYFNEKVLISIKYSEFKQKVLTHIVDTKTVDNFCGFIDNSGLFFKIAAILLSIVAAGLGSLIFYLLKKMKKMDIIEDEENDNKKNLLDNEEK
jgi:hypothetical protein